MPKQKANFLEITQHRRRFIITRLPAGIITKISYAAVRGRSHEEGAIQRVLNASRITSIRDFTLQGGDYPNAIVLNWVNAKNPITKIADAITFKDDPNSAQIIDGQHRVAGIKAAIDEDPQIGKMQIPVVIYSNLTTKECADLFLAINTEQKPVARSLVFDLYGIASEDLVDPGAMRARDIATFLNEDEGSPYQGEIKLPGHKTRKGGIALSTAVSAVKPLIEEKGAFEQIEISELEIQRKIVLNVFVALSRKYGDAWGNKSNAFLWAAGFVGAMDFLRLKLIPYCSQRGSFEVETIEKAIDLDANGLVSQEEIKGLSGSAASRVVYQRLVDAFKPGRLVATTKFKI